MKCEEEIFEDKEIVDYEEDEAGEEESKVIKKRVQEREEEAAKIEALQSNVQENLSPEPAEPSKDNEADTRSIYVGNVDYSSTQENLQEFFSQCGSVIRVTIPIDKWSSTPKGFGYVEFKHPDSVVNAMVLNGTEFRGRALKITPKRTNVPSWQLGPSEAWGGGRGRGRGSGRGAYFMPRARGRGGGFRGRGGDSIRTYQGRGRINPY